MSEKKNSPEKSSSSGSANNFLIPSPLPTKRTRTVSQSEKAHSGPTLVGQVTMFCREKGHGFIRPQDGSEPIFVHISDIDGDFVLKEGDEVTYKLCPIPPKMEKYSACHVRIRHPKEGVQHERWDAPPQHDSQHSQCSHQSHTHNS